MPIITFNPNEDLKRDGELPQSHQEAAESLLGQIEWHTEDRGYCKCPGEQFHTSPTKKKHCEVRIDGSPTIICQHTSCQGEREELDFKLRSTCGKIDKARNGETGIPVSRGKPTPSPSEQATEQAKAIRKRLKEICGHKLCDTISPVPEDASGQFKAHLHLFNPSDWIWHGNTYESSPSRIRTAKEWSNQESPSGNYISHSTFRPESGARANLNVETVKYIVVESDSLSHEEQMGLFAWLRDWCGWDLRMLMDTAGKSLHAWFVYPHHLERFQLKAIFEALKCDRKLLTDSQPSRVAGAIRHQEDKDKNKLYHSDGSPMLKLQKMLWLGEGVTCEPKGFDQICDGDNPDAEILEKLKSVSFNFSVPPPEEPCTYSLNGVEIAHPGNLVGITAQQASGKSSSTTAALAAPMALEPASCDCLGWESRNPNGYAILHFDTEQSRKDHDNLIRRAIRRAGIQEPPEWLQSYSMVGWDIPDMLKGLRASLSQAMRDFGGIHSVWLDGIADFVTSVNEEEECMALVRRLHALSDEFSTVLFNVLHLNPGSDFKSRGHLGSQLERKSETVLQLKKDSDEVVTIFSSKSRRAPIPESRGHRFHWSNEWNMHITCQSQIEESNEKKQGEVYEILKKVWGENTEMRMKSGDLVAQIKKKIKCSDRTAYNKITDLFSVFSFLEKDINGEYFPSKKGKELLK